MIFQSEDDPSVLTHVIGRKATDTPLKRAVNAGIDMTVAACGIATAMAALALVSLPILLKHKGRLPRKETFLAAKRCVDLGIGLAATVPAALVTAAVALPLMVQNKGKLFYQQQRPGKGNKKIIITKLKTMTDDRDADGNLLPDNQRLTKMGRFLREKGIDEVWQILNIIKNEMSLIGPRPKTERYIQVDSEKEKYITWYQEPLKRSLGVQQGLATPALLQDVKSDQHVRSFSVDEHYARTILDDEYAEKIADKHSYLGKKYIPHNALLYNITFDIAIAQKVAKVCLWGRKHANQYSAETAFSVFLDNLERDNPYYQYPRNKLVEQVEDILSNVRPDKQDDTATSPSDPSPS